MSSGNSLVVLVAVVVALLVAGSGKMMMRT